MIILMKETSIRYFVEGANMTSSNVFFLFLREKLWREHNKTKSYFKNCCVRKKNTTVCYKNENLGIPFLAF